ncbi:MAG TPA: amylo-alpha-1,6-glucosidase [Gemmatimonadales bacterium]|nr:amylo-alpha-1,6-glucosidase [Gemmatimonadales bacterium]
MTLSLPIDVTTEWLEADGLGGFASGTTSGIRTRRYHALLLTAQTPPTGRAVLVNGMDVWINEQREWEENSVSGNSEKRAQATKSVSSEREFLTRQRYSPGIVAPEDAAEIESFRSGPWPAWIYRLRRGVRIEQEIFVPRGLPVVAIRWRLLGEPVNLTLSVRLFLSGRDIHALHHENPVFRFDARGWGERLTWTPYEGVPGISALSNAAYRAEPEWYRNFLYSEERARGLDFEEDLASPGVLSWQLGTGPAVLILGVPGSLPAGNAADTFERLSRSEESRRARLGSPLQRAADAYIVKRGSGKTIVAGYPWFTDWGRDTFIAMRGLCLATGRLNEARSILLQWAGLVSRGMLPNRFVDQGDAPEFNSVDASLWYVVAVHDYLRAVQSPGGMLPAADRAALERAIREIVEGYGKGTRYGIRVDSDGLLAAGEPGVQLTWMDAKVGDWVVTPRVGKPVEIQALWLNALRIAEEFTGQYRDMLQLGLKSFNERFWNEATGCLYDVVDADHRPGTVDPTLRPNQILAVGGLPYAVADETQARAIVERVETRLMTPLGLRTLPPDDQRYVPRYEGGVLARDGGYHQGTVWPWLLGPFVEAWVRVRGNTAAAKRQARRRFFEPLLQHLTAAGVGHISEIADAEPPHPPRGCPFQAWSVGEALRLDLQVLAERGGTRSRRTSRAHAAKR